MSARTRKVRRLDPGLQPERTFLSWQRTLVLLIVVGLLYLRGPLMEPLGDAPPHIGPTARLAVLTGLMALAVLLAVHVYRRWLVTGHGWNEPRTGRPPTSIARPWALLVLSASILGFAVVVAVSVLLS